MYIRLIISAFVLLVIVSSLKRTTKYFASCPQKLKSYYVIWYLLMNSLWVFFLGFFITTQIYFIYAFVAVIPISGLFLLAAAPQFSQIQKMLSQKLQSDSQFKKTVFNNPKPFSAMNYFNTPVFIRIMGLLFLVGGVLFLLFLNNTSSHIWTFSM